jgi:hypothetical protein
LGIGKVEEGDECDKDIDDDVDDCIGYEYCLGQKEGGTQAFVVTRRLT